MPSILTSEEIANIKPIVPKTTTKINPAIPAKLYIAHPNPNKWTSTGLEGVLLLTKDIHQETRHFKLVDISRGAGIIWDFEFWKGFVYLREGLGFIFLRWMGLWGD